MNITIIGGSGFVGTRLVDRLLKSGHTVKIADKRMSHKYPKLWVRFDIRNSGDEKKEYPESLTDSLSAPDKAEEAGIETAADFFRESSKDEGRHYKILEGILERYF